MISRDIRLLLTFISYLSKMLSVCLLMKGDRSVFFFYTIQFFSLASVEAHVIVISSKTCVILTCNEFNEQVRV